MSQNPLQTDITPLPMQGRSFLQHRSLPLKVATATAPPTLNSLLLARTVSATSESKKVEKPKRKAKQVSDASDVAAEALRITRESLQKEELAHLRPNGGKFPRQKPFLFGRRKANCSLVTCLSVNLVILILQNFRSLLLPDSPLVEVLVSTSL